MYARYLVYGITIILTAGLFSCTQKMDTAQLQGNWNAISAEIQNIREDRQILEETKMSMIQTDTSMVLSFTGDNATIQVTSQVKEDLYKPWEFQGSWQYLEMPQDSLIVRTGDVAWRFKVSDFSPNRMELAFSIPKMSPHQIHEVVFVKK